MAWSIDLSALMEPYFQERGWDVTLLQLMDGYERLDKNVVRGLSDAAMLKLLGVDVELVSQAEPESQVELVT